MMKPVVAIVGRPNVGKSSLFNRILGRTKALVQDEPGVTRDRNYAVGSYDGRSFILVDTGGIEDEAVAPENRRALARQVREAAAEAVHEADVVVMLFDGKEGLNPVDEELADFVRRSGKPVVVAVNKIDHPKHLDRLAEFYALGFDDPMPISAAHGLQVDDLMEAVLERLPRESEREDVPEPWADEGRRPRRVRRPRRLADDMPAEPTAGPLLRGERPPGERSSRERPDERGRGGDGSSAEGTHQEEVRQDAGDDGEFVLRVAVLGRPNVGKSTLINRLLGFERCLVSDVPGTTRDSTDTYVEIDGRRLILIDTAGIRRRSRIGDRVERMTVSRALRMVEACHVVLLVLDATEGVTDQDARLGALAESRGRAMIVLANKWDRVRDPRRRAREIDDQVHRDLPHLSFAPVLRISALRGAGVERLLPTLDDVDAAHRTRIETARLNRWLEEAVEAQPPPLHYHHPVRLYYATQVGIRPPRIVVFSNDPDGLPEHYRRYLVNRFRASFGLRGSPVVVTLRRR